MTLPQDDLEANNLIALSDRECFALYKQQGDKKALGEVFRRYTDMAYRLAIRYLGNSSEAEDILQETFLQLFKRDPQEIPLPEDVRSWLMKAVILGCKSNLRGKIRRRVREKNYGENLPVEEDHPHQKRELHKTILKAIKDLPIKYRMPVWMTLYEKFSVKESAEALMLKEITFRKQVEQGLLHLRKTLTSAGVGLSGLALAARIGELPVEAAPATLKKYFSSGGAESARLNPINTEVSPATVGSASSASLIKIISILAIVASVTLAVMYVNLESKQNPLIQNSLGVQATEREPIHRTYRFDQGIPSGMEVLLGSWEYHKKEQYWTTERVFMVRPEEKLYYGEPLEMIAQTHKHSLKGYHEFAVCLAGTSGMLSYEIKRIPQSIRMDKVEEYKTILVGSYLFILVDNKLAAMRKYDTTEAADLRLVFRSMRLPITTLSIQELKREDLDRKFRNPAETYRELKAKAVKITR